MIDKDHKGRCIYLNLCSIHDFADSIFWEASRFLDLFLVENTIEFSGSDSFLVFFL